MHKHPLHLSALLVVAQACACVFAFHSLEPSGLRLALKVLCGEEVAHGAI